ncbi:hypothetical protein DEO72_LG1g2804 [Vigna unguiculata]|uniref:Uncharacterized protein n=1 Tax=Vigna unguiculata TaxID=3917 RepID=A0A4D6KRJ6_VIGUN|nr:hypothetical protein DEO72_LG1g2804 [Vigna unguiculata]
MRFADSDCGRWFFDGGHVQWCNCCCCGANDTGSWGLRDSCCQESRRDGKDAAIGSRWRGSVVSNCWQREEV